MQPALEPLHADHVHVRKAAASGPACLAMALGSLGVRRRWVQDPVAFVWRDAFSERLGDDGRPTDAPSVAGLALAALRAGLHVTLHGKLADEDPDASGARAAGLLERALEDASAVLKAALEAGHPVLAVTREHGGQQWLLVVGDTALGLDTHDPAEPTGPLQLPHDQFDRTCGRGPFLELGPGVQLRR